MNDSINRTTRLAVILGLLMALGPLTALSFGSKYASEETWQRAQAGAQNIKREDTLSRYSHPEGIPPYAAGKSVSDVVVGSAPFLRFGEALTATGLDQALAAKEGTFTLFVPSDEAWARIPGEQRERLMNDREAMAEFISRHIVPGRYTATDLLQITQAKNLNGEVMSVGVSARTGGNAGYADAQIVKSNIYAANGVVHVIDRPVL
jgi:uncharacterized surface protein with fasciclin (FAS1) repeats